MQKPTIIAQDKVKSGSLEYEIITDAIEVPGGTLYRTYSPKVSAVGVATTFVPAANNPQDLGI